MADGGVFDDLVPDGRSQPPAASDLSSLFMQQESGDQGPNPGQIQPDTFAEFAKPGERWGDPAAMRTVANRVLDGYSQRYDGDLARVAVAYFSGPGNVTPRGGAIPWVQNVSDANGKSVSSYVRDIQDRAGATVPAAPAAPEGNVFGDLIPQAKPAAATPEGNAAQAPGNIFGDLIPTPKAPFRYQGKDIVEEGPGSEGSFFTPQQIFDRNKPYVRADAGSLLTKLSPDEESQFRQWLSVNKVPFDPDSATPDYDMRGFWKALKSGDPFAVSAIDENDKAIHYPDYWKTPYDLTFSRQSKFATPGAPDWNDQDQLVTPTGEILYDDRNRTPYIGQPPKPLPAGEVAAQAGVARATEPFRAAMGAAEYAPLLKKALTAPFTPKETQQAVNALGLAGQSPDAVAGAVPLWRLVTVLGLPIGAAYDAINGVLAGATTAVKDSLQNFGLSEDTAGAVVEGTQLALQDAGASMPHLPALGSRYLPRPVLPEDTEVIPPRPAPRAGIAQPGPTIEGEPAGPTQPRGAPQEPGPQPHPAPGGATAETTPAPAPRAPETTPEAPEEQAKEEFERALFAGEGEGTAKNPVDVTRPADLAVAEQHVNTNPSDAQIESGNYAKGHVVFQGIPISIENPRGSERRGVAPSGEPWAVTLDHAYGYIKGTEGADGDHVDTYIGPHPDSESAFVVDQIDPKTGKFDETKAVLGARTPEEAAAIYDSGFSDGSGPGRRSAITPMSIPEFKTWLKRGNTAAPAQDKPDAQEPQNPAPAPQPTGRIRGRPVQREPTTLMDFLASIGGVKDTGGELRAMDLHKPKYGFRPGFGWVRRPSGLTPDYAREAAEEAGYLPRDSTISDLYETIDAQLKGGRGPPGSMPWQRRPTEEEELPPETDEERQQRETYQRAGKLGITPHPDATTDEVMAMIAEREAIMAEGEGDSGAIDATADDLERGAAGRAEPLPMSEGDIPWGHGDTGYHPAAEAEAQPPEARPPPEGGIGQPVAAGIAAPGAGVGAGDVERGELAAAGAPAGGETEGRPETLAEDIAYAAEEERKRREGQEPDSEGVTAAVAQGYRKGSPKTAEFLQGWELAKSEPGTRLRPPMRVPREGFDAYRRAHAEAPPAQEQAPEMGAPDYEALFDEAQSLMRKLPGNIGKAKLEGRLSKTQLGALDRLDEIEKIFPSTSPEWQRIWHERRATATQKQETEASKRADQQRARLAELGLADGDRVEFTAASGLPHVAGRKHEGTVKIAKDGTAYVASGGQRLDPFRNPWRKVETTNAAPGGFTDWFGALGEAGRRRAATLAGFAPSRAEMLSKMNWERLNLEPKSTVDALAHAAPRVLAEDEERSRTIREGTVPVPTPTPEASTAAAPNVRPELGDSIARKLEGQQTTAPGVLEMRREEAPSQGARDFAEAMEQYAQRGPRGFQEIRKRGPRAMIDRLRMEANLDEARNRRAQLTGETTRTPPEQDDIREVEDFIDYIGHRMFDDVGMRVVKGPHGVRGQYDVARRAVTIYRSALENGNLPRTAIHELWHSLEQALPREDATAIIGEFRRARAKWLKRNPWARPFIDGDEMRRTLAGEDARAWKREFGARPGAAIVGDERVGDVIEMPATASTYRYFNPSEYFAETMTDRHFQSMDMQDARARSIWGHLKSIWNRMVSGFKRLFGRDATGRVYEGFGRGDYAAPKRGRPVLAERGRLMEERTEPEEAGAPPTAEQHGELPDPLLEGFPEGSHFIEGKGQLGRGQWAVADASGKMIWNLAPSKEQAAAETRAHLRNVTANSEARASQAVRETDIANRLRAGATPTDADIATLNLRPRGSLFEYLSPVVQRMFGISRSQVRAAMGSALRRGVRDTGGEYWIADPKSALTNAARYAEANGIGVTPQSALEREGQSVIAGAGHETPEQVALRQRQQQKSQAEAKMAGRKVARKPQEPAEDLPLFGGERQRTLFSLADPDAPEPAETEGPIGRAIADTRMALGNAAARAAELAADVRMLVAPMAEGTDVARRVAKEFANRDRAAHIAYIRTDGWLEGNFEPERRREMFDALDEQSVYEQLKGAEAIPSGEPGSLTVDEAKMLADMRAHDDALGLNRLSPEERAAVTQLNATSKANIKLAKRLGMYDGDGIPWYAPRYLVDVASGEARRVGREPGGARPMEPIGKNVRTRTARLLRRKHLTMAETEAAAQAKFDDARITGVHDVRAVAHANFELQRAMNGRMLIESIRNVGKAAGQLTVSDGEKPEAGDWFTIDQNPAFLVRVPAQFEKDASGKMVPVKNADGYVVTKRVPIYIRGDFRGPLDAILSRDTNGVYRGMMALKGKTMSVIMYSPAIHNQVEWGRALPAMPGKVATFRIYFEGNAAKNGVPYAGVWDHIKQYTPQTVREFAARALQRYDLMPGAEAAGAFGRTAPTPIISPDMHEFVMGGMVPITHYFGFQDITSVMNEPNLVPGRSWTAKLTAAIPGFFDKDAGEATARAIDRLGNVWHNTLLWDRVADLQMGLAVNFRDRFLRDLARKGIEGPQARRAAIVAAAHLANRFAGALPLEAISRWSRALANIFFFSRTFTVGNLGVMKDAFGHLPYKYAWNPAVRALGRPELATEDVGGIPRDVQALIGKEAEDVIRKTARSMAQRTAAAAILTDMAMLVIGGGILQSAIGILSGESTPEEEVQGYVERLQRLLQRGRENPWELINPFWDVVSLFPEGENEPGKELYVLAGHGPDGAVYLNPAFGKMGREFAGWLTGPLDMLRRKEGTIARPAAEMLMNDDGFGNKVYDAWSMSPTDWGQNLTNILSLFLTDQVPMQSIRAVSDMLAGRGDRGTEIAQIIGPLALGATFSKGAPGGPAMGEIYRAKDEFWYHFNQGMPAIRRDILDHKQDGNFSGAVAAMTKIGVPAAMQKYEIMATLDPAARLTPNQIRDFMQYATPEMKGDLQRFLQEQGGASP